MSQATSMHELYQCMTSLCFLTGSYSKLFIQLLYFKYKAKGYQPQVGKKKLKNQRIKREQRRTSPRPA